MSGASSFRSKRFRLRVWIAMALGVGLGVALGLWGLWHTGAVQDAEAQAPGGINPLYAQLSNADPGFRPRVVLPPMEPITKISLKSAQEADQVLDPNDLVLGVEVQGQARAYPINTLTGPRREVFNDTLGQVPIAATW